MAFAALAIWILIILLVGALVMWAAAREASSSFLSSLIPGSLAWAKKRKKAEEARRGKARIVGSFKIPPSSPPAPSTPSGRKVLATSSSVIEVKSLKSPSPPLPKAGGKHPASIPNLVVKPASGEGTGRPWESSSVASNVGPFFYTPPRLLFRTLFPPIMD